MKKIFLPVYFIILLSWIITGCMTSKTTKFKYTSFKDSVSYAIGANIGKNLRTDFKRNDLDVNWDLLLKGLTSQVKDTVDLFTEEQKKMVLEKFQEQIQIKEKGKAKLDAEKNKNFGRAFLEQNKKNPGVKESPSGLQYRIIKQGTGKFPKDSDTITVNYTGKLIDGKIFNSSIERKEPITFPLNKVIKGWVEGLQLISEGGIIELYIPSELAYGDQPTGQVIPAGSTLIFQVELLKVKSK